MDIGLSEILVIAILAVVFFRPKKLPALSKSFSEAVRGFKKGLNPASPPQEEPKTQINETPVYRPQSQTHEEILMSRVKKKEENS